MNKDDKIRRRGSLSGIAGDFWGNAPSGTGRTGRIQAAPSGTGKPGMTYTGLPGTGKQPGTNPSSPIDEAKELENLMSDMKEHMKKDALLDEAAPGTDAEKTDKEPERDPGEELAELVGLTELKKDVDKLISLVKMQKLREENGLKPVPVSKHLVFTGNPGTGKTTVARILARLYRNAGVLSKGQLVEVDRSGLVAGYVGQTAIKTQEKIKEAMGGVLFIDEAYTLMGKGGNDFGQEAIDTILKAMEDNRDDLVVIVAGYTDLMEQFIGSNPGLRSRFNKYFFFPDYTAEELIQIFDIQIKKYDYTLDEDARHEADEYIRKLEAEKGENFANARDIRNFFEKIVTCQAARMAGVEDPGKEEISLITGADILAAQGRETPETPDGDKPEDGLSQEARDGDSAEDKISPEGASEQEAPGTDGSGR